MTENLESYLCFDIDKTAYMIPVSEVERICSPREADQEAEQAEEEIRWLFPEGKEEEYPYRILLRADHRRYKVCTRCIHGVVQAAPEDQFDLPEELKGRYPWILGVSLQRQSGNLVLLLNGQKLDELAWPVEK